MENKNEIGPKLLSFPKIKKDLSSKEVKLYLSKQKWITASTKIKEVNNWKNTESDPYKYTARASFEILPMKYKRGMCININSYENLAKKLCGEKMSKYCVKITHDKYFKLASILLNISGLSLGILIILELIPEYFSYFGLLWIILPLNIILTANNNILWRIWRKSMMPYIQLYVCLLEAYSFCDLCHWDKRTIIMGPPLFLYNIMVINSDAVYFKKNDKSMITVNLFIYLIWKIFIMVSLRFGFINNIYSDDIITIMVKEHKSHNGTIVTQDTVTINNSQLFFSKATSLIMLIIGQIIFRARHSEQAYALRTNYTIKSNKEWNEINRKNRVTKRLTLDNDVKQTKNFLKI